MKPNTLLSAIALLAPVDAFWRMPCHGRTGLARMDPLVDEGQISDHAHTIHGGSGFGFTTSYNDLRDSNCTSCSVKQDTSAYWTPPLMFLYSNGTSVLVPQVGGMLAYYLLFGDNIQAFPAGFRMLSGDTRERNFSLPQPDPPKSEWTGEQASEKALSQKALGFNCLNYAKDPEPTLFRHIMPDKDYLDGNCPDGLRLELMFPSCWNGELDSKNHRDHVRFSSLVIDGECPKGFEKRLPSLLYETIWNTAAFKGEDGEFVIANGDPTGCGYHGDFINGWDVDFLQSAVDTCTNPSGEVSDCPLFDIQDDSDAKQCFFDMPEQLQEDNCEGPRDGLCGGVPVQHGPEYASELTPGLTVQPTASKTQKSSSVSTQESKMPSELGYRPGTSVITDNVGGSVTVAQVKKPTTETPEKAAEPTKTSSTLTKAASSASQGGFGGNEMVNAQAAPSSSITPTPELPEGHKLVSTSTWTSGGALYVVAYEEVYVTTTVPVVVTEIHKQKHRRHAHHRHDNHAGLGGVF